MCFDIPGGRKKRRQDATDLNPDVLMLRSDATPADTDADADTDAADSYTYADSYAEELPPPPAQPPPPPLSEVGCRAGRGTCSSASAAVLDPLTLPAAPVAPSGKVPAAGGREGRGTAPLPASPPVAVDLLLRQRHGPLQ